MERHLSLRLFQAVGIEIEHMIVGADFGVRPIADELFRDAGGLGPGDTPRGEHERDGIGWCNELVAHVVEMRTIEPAPGLGGLAARFQENVREINRLLARRGARLLPTAMHPWFDPGRETRLWPHDSGETYRAFDRIFDCRGHGWSNLQSVHINLPFTGDEEFGRLHAAIRVALPVLPALAASSPLRDGRYTGFMDSRLDSYRGNSQAVPLVAGRVIPEPVFTERDYRERILGAMYRQIAPLDPDGELQHEWLNARGAIARFDRGAIEIRVLDVQECPAADLAVSAAVVALVRDLVEERTIPFREQMGWGVEPLAAIFDACVRDADQAPLEPRYAAALGGDRCVTAGAFWNARIQRHAADAGMREWHAALDVLARRGPLARRIQRAVGQQPERAWLREVYERLAGCLAEGRPFDA